MPGQYLSPPTAVRYAYSPTMSPSCWIRFRRIVLTPHLLVISFTYSIPRTTEAWQVPFVTNRLHLCFECVNCAATWRAASAGDQRRDPSASTPPCALPRSPQDDKGGPTS